MDGIGVCDFSRRENARNIKIAFLACGRSDTDRFIGKSYVERFPIGLGKYGNCRDPEFPACTYDAEGNFTPVRYKNFVK